MNEEQSRTDEKSNKKKKTKEFFLFPAYNTTKKKSNKKQTKNKSKNKTPSNESSNNIINSNSKENLEKNEEFPPKKNLLIKINEAELEFSCNNKEKIENEFEKEQTKNKNKILISDDKNEYEIKNDKNNKIYSKSVNSDHLNNKNQEKEEYQIDKIYNLNNYNINYFNNMYYIDQSQYSNIDFYPNCNESLFKVHKELFTNLSKEILTFENKADYNLKKIKIYREKIINEIKSFITEKLSENYEFELLYYGSYSTGLSIESSDIDILIKFKIISDEHKSSTQQKIDNIMSLLENAFNQNKEKLKINQINPIYTASVPVIKIECNLKDIIPQEIQKELKEKYFFNFENEILNLNMDLTFNEINNSKEKQIIPSQEIISYIKDKINIYQNIRPLLLVLKRYMQVKKLNSSFHGGISSYSLFLLLYAYILQNMKKNGNNIEYIKDNLGFDLFGFFSFYSNLNFEIYAIDVKKDNPIYLLDKPHENSIMLIDPITGLNVAKSTFRIDQIKHVFSNAIMVLNNVFYEKMNNITNDEDYNILNELFNPFNYNNLFILEDSSFLEPFQ